MPDDQLSQGGNAAINPVDMELVGGTRIACFFSVCMESQETAVPV